LRRQVAARGGHTMLWLFLIAVLAAVVVWMFRRARSKPAS
jgi:cbb3-type cytochrome oxidase subunit 3